MAILKYLRVGDTMELKPNGNRWLKIPSHGDNDANMSGLVLQSEDGSDFWLWFSDAGGLYTKSAEPTHETTSATQLSGGDVTAAAALTSTKMVVGDTASKAVKTTTITVANTTMNMSGVGTLGCSTITCDDDIVIKNGGTIGVTTTPAAITIASGGGLTLSADLTCSEDIVIGDDKLIGSASDPDAMQIDSSGNIILTQNLHLDADNKKLQLGAETTDSYIYFDGTHLQFYDTNIGASKSLEDLLTGTQLNPTVWGDLGVGEGKFDWTDAVDEVAGTWVFANTSASDIDISSAVEDGECIQIVANSLTTGKALLIETDSIGAAGALVHLDITQAGHDNAGFFFECYDGSANQFQIGEYGATTIKGVGGGTAVLTFTKGDLVMSDGVINSDVDSAHGHNFATSQAGSATYPLLTLTSSDSSHDQPLLKATSASTGDVDVVEIDNFGTGYGLSIDLGGKTDAKAIEVIFDVGSTTNGVFLDAGTGTQTFVGSTGAGMLKIHQTGTLLHATASAILVDFDGVPAASGLGYCLNIDDDSSVISGTYAVSVNALANNAMKLETQSVDMSALTLLSKANTVVPVVFIDGDTNNWLGADNKGMLTIDNDIAMDAGGSLLVLDYSGTGASNAEGTCFRALDTGSAAANTPYAAEISSTANNALQISTVATGKTALTLKSGAATTAAVLKIDGDTNGWTGTNNVGMLHIDNDTALAQTTASMVLIDYATVKPKDSAEGYCLRVADAAPVATTPPAYAVYIDSTANEALGIETRAVAAKNLVLMGVQSQTDMMLHVDGTTGTGWTGAANVGMVQIESIVAHAETTGTNLLVTHATGQPKASAAGYLARFVSTGTAQAGADAVEIIAKDSTEYGLNISSGMLKVAGTSTLTGAVTATAGIQSTAVALTALASNGVATPAGTTFVDVTSDSADKIVDLPTPVLGNVVYYMENSAVGYELAPQADTQYINNTLCGSAKELAIAAASLIVAVCIVGGASGKWYVSYIGNDGAWNAGGTPN